MLKGKTSKKDKDFFIIFIIDVLLKDNKNLFLSLNDVSLKFKHIEELITKTLDISGYATIIHNVIFSKSIILIHYNHLKKLNNRNSLYKIIK